MLYIISFPHPHMYIKYPPNRPPSHTFISLLILSSYCCWLLLLLLILLPLLGCLCWCGCCCAFIRIKVKKSFVIQQPLCSPATQTISHGKQLKQHEIWCGGEDLIIVHKHTSYMNWTGCFLPPFFAKDYILLFIN